MIRCAGVIWDTGQFSVQKLSSSSSMVLWMPSDVLSPHPPCLRVHMRRQYGLQLTRTELGVV